MTGDGTLWYWGGAERAPLTPVADNCASALSVCGCFAVVETEGTLSLLDGQERRPLAEHTAEISPLDNRGDGCRLLVLDSNRQLRILSIQREADRPMEAELSSVVDTGVAVLYDGGYLKDDHTLWGWEDSADAPVQVGRSVVSASLDGPKLTLLHRSGLLVQKDRNSLFMRVYPLQTAFFIPAGLLILGIWAGAYLVYQKRDIRIKQQDT